MNPTNTPFSVQTVGARRRGKENNLHSISNLEKPRSWLKKKKKAIKNQDRLFHLPFSKSFVEHLACTRVIDCCWVKLEGRSESGLCFRTQASLQEHGSVGRQRRELYELTKHEATRSLYLPKLYREAYLVLAKLIAFLIWVCSREIKQALRCVPSWMKLLLQ